MNPIKNIIFDFGGIFIDIDYMKTEQAFIDAGVVSFHELYSQHNASSLFEDLETGKKSPLEFYDSFRQTANINLANEQIEHAWNAMLGNFLLDEINWLETIGSQYRIFLYSNTNKIHHDAFSAAFKKLTGKDFDDYFIKAYYSHTLGLRKPYRESYEAILQEQGLLATETLFIDDTLKNIEGARLAGLQTIHLVPPHRVSQLGL
jgi:HAD superfamily hydrolase (TIGR01549 family)